VLVLGATGRTGRELVAGALAQGHQVSALVRDQGRLRDADPRLRVVSGSATDPASIEKAVAGQQAVLCALGPRSPLELARSVLMRRSVRSLVASMERSGASRLILLSALGVGESARQAPAMSRIAFATLLRQVAKDKERAERVVRASGLDWTIVYPPSLTNGPASGGYRHGETLRVGPMARISRADVADFMLSQLADRAYSRRAAIIGP
jgi:putative NADH-flavin reductase